MKNAIEREQSQACLNYAKRKHFGRKPKLKVEKFKKFEKFKRTLDS